jgi:hypothetical protein
MSHRARPTTTSSDPYCPYRRTDKSKTLQRAIAELEAKNEDSDFDPWKICKHGRGCIVAWYNIPHFYPWQCGPVQPLFHPHLADKLLVASMERIEERTKAFEEAINSLQPAAGCGATSQPSERVMSRRG